MALARGKQLEFIPVVKKISKMGKISGSSGVAESVILSSYISYPNMFISLLQVTLKCQFLLFLLRVCVCAHMCV